MKNTKKHQKKRKIDELNNNASVEEGSSTETSSI